MRCGGMRTGMKGKNRRGRTSAVNERGREGRGTRRKRNGRGAERADRCLLWTTVKPSMPLAFDNYSRSVLGDVQKMSVFVLVRTNTPPSSVTHFYKLS